MLKDRNIAFFIDVDNVGLKSENYATVMEQLNGMGTVLCGKIYGAGERKHKEIFADAELHGYRIERPMRVKRRGRKEFDPRIYVDVVDAVTKAPAIDTVCVVARSADMVYLYSYLHSRGIKIVATEDADDVSRGLIDEFVDLGMLFELKFPETPKAPKSARQAKPAAAVQAAPADQSESQGLDRTDELLREIERLRQDAEPTSKPAPVEDFHDEPQTEEPQEQAATEQPDSEEEQTASIVDEAKLLLERIAEMRDEQQAADLRDEPQTEEPQEQTATETTPPEQSEEAEEPSTQSGSPVAQQETAPEQEQTVEEQPTGEQPAEEQTAEEQPEQEQPTEEQPVGTQHTTVTSGNDSDLIKRIEEIRKSSQGNDDDYLDEIRKLLDGLE